jgi:hypothetical protein
VLAAFGHEREGSRTPDIGQEQPKPTALTPQRPEPASHLA